MSQSNGNRTQSPYPLLWYFPTETLLNCSPAIPHLHLCTQVGLNTFHAFLSVTMTILENVYNISSCFSRWHVLRNKWQTLALEHVGFKHSYSFRTIS